MHQLLLSIQLHMKHYFSRSKSVIGKNLSALQIIQKQLSDINHNDLFGGETPAFF
jgi:hypothetical protein